MEYYVRSLEHYIDMKYAISLNSYGIKFVFYGSASIYPLTNVSMISLIVILYIVSMFSVNRSPKVVFTASKNGTSIF